MIFFLLSTLARSADPITAIRDRWTATQAAREGGRLYPLAIDGNPSNRMYAAIGTYQNRVTCFRDTPPEEPYPADKPVLITVQYEVAARNYSGMFLYSDAGQLQFAFYEGPEGPPLRVYWQGDQVLRVQEGDSILEQGAWPDRAATLGENGRGLHAMCTTVSSQEARWRDLGE